MDFDFPLELILQGNVLMLDKLFKSFANDNNYSAFNDDRSPSPNDFFSQLIVSSGESLGFLRLQGLPQDRILIRIWPITNISEEKEKRFRSFCELLLKELARLGFFEILDIPKDPIGFRKG